MPSLLRFAVCSLSLFFAVPAWAVDQLPRMHQAVEPFLSKDTMLLGWLDLNNSNPTEAWNVLAEASKDRGLEKVQPTIKPLQLALLNNGCSMVYVVAELPELLSGQPRLIFPSSQPDSVKSILGGIIPNQPMTVQNNCVLLSLGAPPAYSASKSSAPPELLEAVAQNSHPIGVAIAASDAFRQLLPIWKAGFKSNQANDQVVFDHLEKMRSLAAGLNTDTFVGDAKLTMADEEAAKSVEQWLSDLAEQRLQRPLQSPLDISGNSVEAKAQNREQLIAAFSDIRAVGMTGARRTSRMNDFKQVMLAFHNFHSAYNRLPPQSLADKDGNKLLSWRVALLPFMGEQKLWQKFHLDESWDSPHNKPLIKEMPRVFAGSLPVEEGKTTIVAPLTPDSAMGRPGKSTQFRDMKDGLSNTIGMVNVVTEHAVIWSKPDDLVFDPAGWQTQLVSPGENGFIATMWDGSVHYLPAQLKTETLTKLLTIDGKEVIDHDELEMK